MTKAKEFRNLTKQELLNKCDDLAKQLYDLRSQVRLGRIDRPHRFTEIKKDMARINTVLREEMKSQLSQADAGVKNEQK